MGYRVHIWYIVRYVVSLVRFFLTIIYYLAGHLANSNTSYYYWKLFSSIPFLWVFSFFGYISKFEPEYFENHPAFAFAFSISFAIALAVAIVIAFAEPFLKLF